MVDTERLWAFLPWGYVVGTAIESLVLYWFLSPGRSLGVRLSAGIWLTACTYPVVVLVLPVALAGQPRWWYLLVAETFAPLAECGLFWLAFGVTAEGGRLALARDFGAIVVANLTSFALGAWLFANY